MNQARVDLCGTGDTTESIGFGGATTGILSSTEKYANQLLTA